MDTGFMNRIIGLVIALVVGGLLVGGLLLPNMAMAQTALYDKEYHTNAQTAPYIEETTDYTCIVDSAGATINGESTTIPAYTQVVTTDKGVLYMTGSGTYTLFMPDQQISKRILIGTNQTSMTTTISNKVWTVSYVNTDTNQTVEYTTNVGLAYAYTGVGEYTETASTGSAITFDVNPGQSGVITIGDGYYSTNNGIAIVSDWTTGSATLNYNVFSGYGAVGEEHTANVSWTVTSNADGSYTISNIESDLEGALTAGTHRVLYPNEYYTYVDNSYTIMFGVIPILGTIILIVVAANGIRNKY